MKNCTGINCIMQLGKVDPATCPAVGYCQQATPPQTNADRLRAMSDEELAEWMATVPMSYEDVCPNPIPKECNGGDRETCIQCWLDWLRQEAADA